MSDFDNTLLVDPDRQACLCDVGAPGLVATVVVDANGVEHLVLADRDLIGDENACVDTGCQATAHEQLGGLPIEFVRRITVSRRRVHRCGRPTKTTGQPCRIEVPRPGEPCGLHRTVPRPEDAPW